MTRIVAKIILAGSSPDVALLNVVVTFSVHPPIDGYQGDSLAFNVDATFTDTQLEADLREQVAAHVNAATTAGTSFTGADVIGCKF